MEKELDFEKDTSINPNQLDIEWIYQANTFMKYCHALSEAAKEMDNAKQYYETVRAQCELKVRNKPEHYCKLWTGEPIPDKVTEAVISSILVASEGKEGTPLFKAKAEWNESKFDFNILNNAKQAMEHKKVALENLVRLTGQQYFAGPKTPRDIVKLYNAEEQNRRTTDLIKKRKQRRVKK